MIENAIGGALVANLLPVVMPSMSTISRRVLFLAGASISLKAVSPQKTEEHSYRFVTADFDVQLLVEFHDRYASDGFWFKENLSNRRFCLSGNGDGSRACLRGFTGSVAIARYRLKPRSGLRRVPNLREHVRTIDQDPRLPERAPFDRTIPTEEGLASDIQAFGYETASLAQAPVKGQGGIWCLLRQDLHFEGEGTPFLVVHWKHELDRIRIMDIIPGSQTLVLRS